MADYIIWHIEREPNRRYPLGGGIRTVEDVSGNIFELTNVDSCTIIEWAKKAKIIVLIEAGDEVRREAQIYLREHTNMGIFITVEKKKISLPLDDFCPPLHPSPSKKNRDRYQLLRKTK